MVRKSQTITWDGAENLVNYGINWYTTKLNWCRISEPSTVYSCNPSRFEVNPIFDAIIDHRDTFNYSTVIFWCKVASELICSVSGMTMFNSIELEPPLKVSEKKSSSSSELSSDTVSSWKWCFDKQVSGPGSISFLVLHCVSTISGFGWLVGSDNFAPERMQVLLPQPTI